MGYGPSCNIACCHQGGFGDWFTWYVSHLLREYGVNGIYLDDTWPYGCSNAAHGRGFVRADGKRHLAFPLRARLETYRRLRTVPWQTGSPFWIAAHMSAGRVPPLASFADGLLLGEELYHDVAGTPTAPRA